MPKLEDVARIQPSRNAHEVAVCPAPGEYAGNENRWELDCDVCGYIGAADTEAEAWAMGRVHSAMRSVD